MIVFYHKCHSNMLKVVKVSLYWLGIDYFQNSDTVGEELSIKQKDGMPDIVDLHLVLCWKGYKTLSLLPASQPKETLNLKL